MDFARRGQGKTEGMLAGMLQGKKNKKTKKHDGQLWMVQEVVTIICKVPMLWDIFITVNQSFWRLCSVSLSPTRSPPQNVEVQQMEQPTSSPDLNHLFSLIKKERKRKSTGVSGAESSNSPKTSQNRSLYPTGELPKLFNEREISLFSWDLTHFSVCCSSKKLHDL